MTIKFNQVGQLTKGIFAGWYVVVKQLSIEDAGYFMIYSRENLFNDKGELQTSQDNEVYDEFLLTLQEVIYTIEEDYGVIWLE